MTTKINIVTYDRGGAQAIAGVYSTREGAEAALRLAGEPSELLVFELDAPLPAAPAGRVIWHVYHGTKLNEFTIYRESVFEPQKIDKVEHSDGCFNVNVWAQDEKEAKRLAIALFQPFLKSV